MGMKPLALFLLEAHRPLEFFAGQMMHFTAPLLGAFLPRVKIDRVALPPTGAVILDGDYDPNWIFFLGMTLSVTFSC